jgi:hypothetical protein
MWTSSWPCSMRGVASERSAEGSAFEPGGVERCDAVRGVAGEVHAAEQSDAGEGRVVEVGEASESRGVERGIADEGRAVERGVTARRASTVSIRHCSRSNFITFLPARSRTPSRAAPRSRIPRAAYSAFSAVSSRHSSAARIVRSGPQEAISAAVICAPSAKSQTFPARIASISRRSAARYSLLPSPMSSLWHRRAGGSGRHPANNGWSLIRRNALGIGYRPEPLARTARRATCIGWDNQGVPSDSRSVGPIPFGKLGNLMGRGGTFPQRRTSPA